MARGVHVLPELPPALAVAGACRGAVSHESAAALLGLELVQPPRTVHVTCPRGAKPPAMKQVVVHRRGLAPGEVDGDVTTPLRTVLDCCLTLPFREAVAVAADPFESVLRADLVTAGLDTSTPQLEIITRSGHRMVVDLGDPRRRVVIEAEGFRWHGDPRSLIEDCRRYDDLIADGWLVLRFAFDHVMFDSAWIVETVRRVLRMAAVSRLGSASGRGWETGRRWVIC